jgi:hypothetical protein
VVGAGVIDAGGGGVEDLGAAEAGDLPARISVIWDIR